MRRFEDRRRAGRELGEALARFRPEHPVVVGLPRGGVPVAAEVASAIGAPLDVIVVRKVGVPGQSELAMGAVGEDGVRVVNERIIRLAGVRPEEFERVESRERAEVEQRAIRFRPPERRIPLVGRTVIVVDDGIATGSTARAAIQVARAHGAAKVVLAVPVGAQDSLRDLESEADEVVALLRPADFAAVGYWYRDFDQVGDDEVRSILGTAWASRDAARPS